MSFTKEALRSAAARHLGDASAMLRAGNWDQAEHLVGFAPECARKAALDSHWHRLLGHVLVVGPVLEALEALESMASCVRIPERALEALRSWKPECRYQATGIATEGSTRDRVAAADLATTNVLAAAWVVGQW